jgi:hypothetical protein
VGRRAGGGGDRRGRGHANSHVTGNSRGSYNARHRIEEIRRKKASEANDSDDFLPSSLDFATCSSRRNSSLLGSPSTTRKKTQFNGLGATPYPLKTLVAITT